MICDPVIDISSDDEIQENADVISIASDSSLEDMPEYLSIDSKKNVVLLSGSDQEPFPNTTSELLKSESLKKTIKVEVDSQPSIPNKGGYEESVLVRNDILKDRVSGRHCTATRIKMEPISECKDSIPHNIVSESVHKNSVDAKNGEFPSLHQFLSNTNAKTCSITKAKTCHNYVSSVSLSSPRLNHRSNASVSIPRAEQKRKTRIGRTFNSRLRNTVDSFDIEELPDLDDDLEATTMNGKDRLCPKQIQQRNFVSKKDERHVTTISKNASSGEKDEKTGRQKLLALFDGVDPLEEVRALKRTLNYRDDNLSGNLVEKIQNIPADELLNSAMHEIMLEDGLSTMDNICQLQSILYGNDQVSGSNPNKRKLEDDPSSISDCSFKMPLKRNLSTDMGFGNNKKLLASEMHGEEQDAVPSMSALTSQSLTGKDVFRGSVPEKSTSSNNNKCPMQTQRHVPYCSLVAPKQLSFNTRCETNKELSEPKTTVQCASININDSVTVSGTQTLISAEFSNDCFETESMLVTGDVGAISHDGIVGCVGNQTCNISNDSSDNSCQSLTDILKCIDSETSDIPNGEHINRPGICENVGFTTCSIGSSDNSCQSFTDILKRIDSAISDTPNAEEINRPGVCKNIGLTICSTDPLMSPERMTTNQVTGNARPPESQSTTEKPNSLICGLLPARMDLGERNESDSESSDSSLEESTSNFSHLKIFSLPPVHPPFQSMMITSPDTPRTFTACIHNLIDACYEEGGQAFVSESLNLYHDFTNAKWKPSEIQLRIAFDVLQRGNFKKEVYKAYGALVHVLNYHPPWDGVPFTWNSIEHIAHSLLMGNLSPLHHLGHCLTLMYFVYAVETELLLKWKQVKESVAWRWLSPDSNYNKHSCRIVEWIFKVTTSGEYLISVPRAIAELSLDDTKSDNHVCQAEIPKLLPLLNRLLEIGIVASLKPVSACRRIASDIIDRYFSIEFQQRKHLLSLPMCPMLKFKVTQLALSRRFSGNLPPEDIPSVESLIDSIKVCQLTQTATRDDCEELTLLVTCCVSSFIRTLQEGYHIPLLMKNKRASTSGLAKTDVTALKNTSHLVTTMRTILGKSGHEIDSKMANNLDMLECFGDMEGLI